MEDTQMVQGTQETQDLLDTQVVHGTPETPDTQAPLITQETQAPEGTQELQLQTHRRHRRHRRPNIIFNPATQAQHSRLDTALLCFKFLDKVLSRMKDRSIINFVGTMTQNLINDEISSSHYINNITNLLRHYKKKINPNAKSLLEATLPQMRRSMATGILVIEDFKPPPHHVAFPSNGSRPVVRGPAPVVIVRVSQATPKKPVAQVPPSTTAGAVAASGRFGVRENMQLSGPSYNKFRSRDLLGEVDTSFQVASTTIKPCRPPIELLTGFRPVDDPTFILI